MHASLSPPQCQLNVPLDLSELQLLFMQFMILNQNKGDWLRLGDIVKAGLKLEKFDRIGN